MSEETTKTSVLTRIREWVSAHPVVTGVIAGTTVVLAAQLITQRANAELEAGSDPLVIEGENVE
jgi:hypothetical protein|nr:MAG TPA: hypothetical protein [Caudoviricetes sp.]